MEDKRWWTTKGFNKGGSWLGRDGDTDRTLEEIKHLFTIPEIIMIEVTKKHD